MPSNIALKNLSFLTELGIDEKNTGSAEYQIAVLTYKISYLSNHVRKHKKDHTTKRGLIVLVNRRKSLMTYLNKQNHDSLTAIVKKLDIRNTAA